MRDGALNFDYTKLSPPIGFKMVNYGQYDRKQHLGYFSRGDSMTQTVISSSSN